MRRPRMRLEPIATKVVMVCAQFPRDGGVIGMSFEMPPEDAPLYQQAEFVGWIAMANKLGAVGYWRQEVSGK